MGTPIAPSTVPSTVQSTVQLSAGIMAIPARANHVLNYLLPALRGAEVPTSVSWDSVGRKRSGQSLWHNSKRAWATHDPTATHHLHLQDDARLCKSFVGVLYAMIAAVPDQVINLFLTSRPIIDKALQQNIHWIRCTGVCWGLGNIMPVPLIHEFLEWESAHVNPLYFHDDGRLEMWTQLTHREVWLPVPQPLQHLGGLRSSLGHAHGEKLAACFIDDVTPDPLSIDWTPGNTLSLKHPVEQTYLQKWVKL